MRASHPDEGGLKGGDFPRVDSVLAEGCAMVRCALLGVSGFLALCLPLSACPPPPDSIVSLDDKFIRLPALTLSDSEAFSFATAFNRVEATPEFLPALNMPKMTASSKPKSVKAKTSAALSTDSSKETIEVQRRNLFDYAGGEVGVFYGRSFGKHGGDVEAGYIRGEVGDDKFHISAGASYEHSSGLSGRSGLRRWGR